MNNKALTKMSYGVYIVSSVKDGKFNGQIANTVFQTTSQPALIAISINKQNLTHEYIKTSKVFSVSVLSQKATMLFIGQFGFKSGRDTDKFKSTNFKTGVTGAPIVTDFATAFLEAKVTCEYDAVTHTIFIGEMTEADVLNEDEPMTYDYYHKVVKGKSPKTAPTYISNQ